MPKYIDADEFAKKNREWYCEQCQNRKGMKRGKLQFVYEIGDAPCRACDVDDVISDIEDFPAADVVPVVRCKDCRHTKTDGIDAIYCQKWDRWEMPPNAYCYLGEKRKAEPPQEDGE